ncbi:hypothetical protein Ddye_010092 [Dipteronia dyeriana]|uniref:Uncharacterized protein n=1 Tax=Dipteronia dyeriana TaxID=168575 RepID=A0AAE0CMT9_9ROSI|nr:hypothetical protein Ddye_010092 [Dipteronia dyeriana]
MYGLFLFALAFGYFSLQIVVHAQDQSGLLVGRAVGLGSQQMVTHTSNLVLVTNVKACKQYSAFMFTATKRDIVITGNQYFVCKAKSEQWNQSCGLVATTDVRVEDPPVAEPSGLEDSSEEEESCSEAESAQELQSSHHFNNFNDFCFSM